MALRTFGTTANSSLRAVQFHQSYGVMTDSDLAAFDALVNPNFGGASPMSGFLQSYIERSGQFFIPGRGWVAVQNGDWMVIDLTTGFPFVLSQNAVASGPYVHS